MIPGATPTAIATAAHTITVVHNARNPNGGRLLQYIPTAKSNKAFVINESEKIGIQEQMRNGAGAIRENLRRFSCCASQTKHEDISADASTAIQNVPLSTPTRAKHHATTAQNAIRPNASFNDNRMGAIFSDPDWTDCSDSIMRHVPHALHPAR
jgi:hypothetical protein